MKCSPVGSLWIVAMAGLMLVLLSCKDDGVTSDPIEPPEPSAYVIAGTNNGVFVSTDDGLTWMPESTMVTGTFVWSLLISRTTDGRTSFYAATALHGVYRSTDNGLSWTESGLKDATVYALTLVGTDLFAGLDGGTVLHSTDEGATWNVVSPVWPNSRVSCLVSSDSNLFVAVGGNVFSSSDKGTQWNYLGLYPPVQVNTLAFTSDVSGNAILVAGGIAGLWSFSGSFGWTAVDSGQTGVNINTLTTSNSQDGIDLFAGTDHGVFGYDFDGTSWTRMPFGLVNSVVLSLGIVVNKSGGKNLFAGTSSGAFLSTDNGVSWRDISAGLADRDGNRCVVLSLVTIPATE